MHIKVSILICVHIAQDKTKSQIHFGNKILLFENFF